MKTTNSVRGMNITEKIYNIIYNIEFQTYTMQTRPTILDGMVYILLLDRNFAQKVACMPC